MGRYATAAGGGTDFKQAPAGNHLARCIGIIDIGTHDGEWKGKAIKRNQVILRWELPFETELFDGVEKPLIVSKFYTNSLSDKANLRKHLESWRTREFTVQELLKFDLESIVGAACTLSVIHNEAGKAKVVGIAGLTKGTTCPPMFNKRDVFWIDPWDDNAFAALPKYYQGLIQESDEYKQFNGGARAGARDIDLDPVNPPYPDDDVPF